MKFTEKINRAIKAFSSEPKQKSDGQWRTLSGSVSGIFSLEWNFENIIRNGYFKNPVMAACVGVWQKAFAEPEVKVCDEDGEEYGDPDIERLLENPNPWMSFSRFSQFIAAYQILGGDAYIYKRRTPAGRIEMLIPMHSGQCLPVVEKGSKNFIDYYALNLGNGQFAKIAPSEIIQITGMYIDPLNPNTSKPPISLVAHESETLFLQMQQTMSLLRNDGMPRTVLMLDKEADPTPEEMEYMKARFEQRTTGAAFGGPMILKGGTKVERVDYSPEELDQSPVRDYIEFDICAVLQVPPIVAGVKVGSDQSTYNNVREAKAAFTEDSLLPRLTAFADDLTKGLDEDNEGFYIEFDPQSIAAYERLSSEQRQKSYKEIILPIYAAIKRGELTPETARLSAEKFGGLDADESLQFFPDTLLPEPQQPELPKDEKAKFKMNGQKEKVYD